VSIRNDATARLKASKSGLSNPKIVILSHANMLESQAANCKRRLLWNSGDARRAALRDRVSQHDSCAKVAQLTKPLPVRAFHNLEAS
jgi:hypothetical protein